MVRRLSKQRQAVIDLLRREGETSPARVADVLEVPGTARKLLFGMLADGALESPSRGRYTLPAEPSVTFDGDVTGDVTESVDVTADVTGPDAPPIEPPILGESPSGRYAWSQIDGGMISVETLRKRKGYLS